MFDGKIGFESKHNEGSCFTFSFMLEEDKSEENEKGGETKFDIDSSNLAFIWKPDYSKLMISQPNEIRYITDLFNILDSQLEASSKKILIVDDQSFNIQALKVILKFKVGIDVDKTCDSSFDGYGAIKLIEEDVSEKLQQKLDSKKENSDDLPLRCKYDLILMDCNMPFIDGYETTKRIRQHLFENNFIQPIISAVTGHNEESYVDKAIKSGMN